MQCWHADMITVVRIPVMRSRYKTGIGKYMMKHATQLYEKNLRTTKMNHWIVDIFLLYGKKNPSSRFLSITDMIRMGKYYVDSEVINILLLS